MNYGCINGELHKYSDRQKVRKYIASLDITKEERQGFFEYWIGLQNQQQRAEELYQQQQRKKLADAKRKARGKRR